MTDCYSLHCNWIGQAHNSDLPGLSRMSSTQTQALAPLIATGCCDRVGARPSAFLVITNGDYTSDQFGHFSTKFPFVLGPAWLAAYCYEGIDFSTPLHHWDEPQCCSTSGMLPNGCAHTTGNLTGDIGGIVMNQQSLGDLQKVLSFLGTYGMIAKTLGM